MLALPFCSRGVISGEDIRRVCRGLGRFLVGNGVVEGRVKKVNISSLSFFIQACLESFLINRGFAGCWQCPSGNAQD